MKIINIERFMKRFLFYGIGVLGLVSCGFKGPLYLPKEEDKSASSSVVKSNPKKVTASVPKTIVSVAKTSASAAIIKNNTNAVIKSDASDGAKTKSITVIN